MTASPDLARLGQLFIRAVELFDSRVRDVSDDAWLAPSPCEGWVARDVVAHCAANLSALSGCLDGGDFLAAFGQPFTGDVMQAWRSQSEHAADVAAQTLARETILVAGTPAPTTMIVDGLVRDLVIHTWDLARAIGADDRLPEDMVAAATDAMTRVTPEMRVPGFYGPDLTPPDGADAQTKLLASSGRLVG